MEGNKIKAAHDYFKSKAKEVLKSNTERNGDAKQKEQPLDCTSS